MSAFVFSFFLKYSRSSVQILHGNLFVKWLKPSVILLICLLQVNLPVKGRTSSARTVAVSLAGGAVTTTMIAVMAPTKKDAVSNLRC